MEVKKLEKAIKIHNELLGLEEEIIELNKLALKINNGKFNITLSLELEEINKTSKEKVGFEDDGSLVMDATSFANFIFNPFKPKLNIENNVDYSQNISDSTVFNILAFLLNEKQSRKMELQKKLIKMGVKI